MECLWCGKILQGGFGVGVKPYKAFACADCVLKRTEEESRVFALGMLEESVRRAWAHYGDGYYVPKKARESVSSWLRVLNERKEN